MKLCSKCKTNKPIIEFNKSSTSKDGLYSQCKRCKKISRNSKSGLIGKIYDSQVQSCKIRKMPMPQYSKAELKGFIEAHSEFNKLYDTWVESDFNKRLTPSIDRLDDYKSYSIDNISLTTWGHNEDKHHIDRVEGRNNKASKSVSRFALNGEYIDSFHSVAEANRITNVNNSDIVSVCKGNRNKAGGYIWKYKEVS